MKYILYIVVTIFLLLFLSCRKDALQVDENFEGDWFGILDTTNHSAGEHSDLNINSNGKADYESYDSRGERVYIFGGKATISGNKLHISGIISGHNFTIVSFPFQINASNYQWKMILINPGGKTMPYYRN